ncbi:MAG TPA: hypothetical protein VH593_27075, partial [Ktedonobacteraceae bacterium]
MDVHTPATELVLQQGVGPLQRLRIKHEPHHQQARNVFSACSCLLPLWLVAQHPARAQSRLSRCRALATSLYFQRNLQPLSFLWRRATRLHTKLRAPMRLRARE